MDQEAVNLWTARLLHNQILVNAVPADVIAHDNVGQSAYIFCWPDYIIENDYQDFTNPG